MAQRCYFGPGAVNRGPAELVPCKSDGQSACCLLGDTCFSGNACYNYDSGNLYQYGCTDINYEDESCPPKCGFSPGLSPWTALELCSDLPGVNNTWVCHAPESCGCDWGDPTYDLLKLTQRGCSAMGSDARVALYAPETLAPYVSLPSSLGGSTGYYSPTVVNGTKTWFSTSVSGYTPKTVSELTTYEPAPRTPVELRPGVTPAASTVPGPSREGDSSTRSSGGSALTAATTSIATPSSTQSTTSASTPTAGGATRQSSTAAVATSPAAAATTSAASSSLTTGAKIGIGVGVAGGVIGLVAIGVLFYIWHRRRYQRRATAEQQEQAGRGSLNGDPSVVGVPGPYSGEKSQYSRHTWGSPTASDVGTLAPSPPHGHAMPYYGSPALFGEAGSPYDDMAQKQQYQHNHHHSQTIPSPPIELDTDRRVHEIGSEADYERVSLQSPPLPQIESQEARRD